MSTNKFMDQIIMEKYLILQIFFLLSKKVSLETIMMPILIYLSKITFLNKLSKKYIKKNIYFIIILFL